MMQYLILLMGFWLARAVPETYDDPVVRPQADEQDLAGVLNAKIEVPGLPSGGSTPTPAPTPAGTTLSPTSVSGGGSDDLVVISSFDSHLAVVVPGLIVFVVCHIWVAFTREKWVQFYQRRVSRTGDESHVEAPGGLNYFSALRFVIMASDEDLIKHAGFDAYIFIQAQEILVEICGVLGIVGVIILFPIYDRGGNSQPDGYERLSIGNLVNGSNELWAPAAFVWMATMLAIRILQRNMVDIEILAKAYKLNAFGREYTVLVQNIPDEFRFENGVRSYFQGVFTADSVFSVRIVRKVDKLRGLLADLRFHYKALLTARLHKKKKKTKPMKWVVGSGPLELIARVVAGKEADDIKEFASDNISDLNDGGPSQPDPSFLADIESHRKTLASLNFPEGRHHRRIHEEQNELEQDETDLAEDTINSTPCCWRTTAVRVDAIRYHDLVCKYLRRKITDERGNNHEAAAASFVTFNRLTTAAMAAQTVQLDKEGMDISIAPEGRDILWTNLEKLAPETREARESSTYCSSFWLKVTWAIPIAFVAAISSIESLQRYLPGISTILSANPTLGALITGLLPVIAVSILNGLLPDIYAQLGIYRGIWTKSTLALYVLQNYHYHIVLHSFIVLTIAGSVFQSIQSILTNPFALFSLLGQSIPAFATFFLNFVTLAAFSTVAQRLTQFAPLAIGIITESLVNSENDKDSAFDPGPVDYRRDWGTDLLIWTICVSYAAIQPMVMVMGMFYYAHNYVVSAYRIIYMHRPEFETAGLFVVTVYQRICAGLILSQITIIGVLSAKFAFLQAATIVPFIYITWKYISWHSKKYKGTLENHIIPLISASVLDSERKRSKIIRLLTKRHEEQVWRQPEMSANLSNPLAQKPGEPKPAPKYLKEVENLSLSEEEVRSEKLKNTLKKLRSKDKKRIFTGREKDEKIDWLPDEEIQIYEEDTYSMKHMRKMSEEKTPKKPYELSEIKKFGQEDVFKCQKYGKRNPLLRNPARMDLFDPVGEDLRVTLQIADFREEAPAARGDNYNFLLEDDDKRVGKLVEMANLGLATRLASQADFPEEILWTEEEKVEFYLENDWLEARILKVKRSRDLENVLRTITFKDLEVQIYIPSLHAVANISGNDPRLRRPTIARSSLVSVQCIRSSIKTEVKRDGNVRLIHKNPLQIETDLDALDPPKVAGVKSLDGEKIQREQEEEEFIN